MGKYILVLAVLLLPSQIWASQLVQSECEGIVFYSPRGEEDIVLRLHNRTGEILTFLKERGLPVTPPLHVVLDGDLDQPEVVVRMIPHREIRIPLRAPGVLEDGYLEKDPWLYFYFKGLCLMGIYSMRSGLPALGHHVFGEAVSPNLILPPWLTEGTCRTLFAAYNGSSAIEPFNRALLHASIPRDISHMSNHPEHWPGSNAYRIYGIPFVSWVNKTYGWERLRQFYSIHGAGIIPIEIDLKAGKTFGRTWSEIWSSYLSEMNVPGETGSEAVIDGYWPRPAISWNASGI
ncbi:hypothetical protein EG833_04890, partial [archaeon]|nr:hypothetical protein [archaeon]